MAQVRAAVLDANLGHPRGIFWQKRYYNRNIRDERKFVDNLRHIQADANLGHRFPSVYLWWCTGVVLVELVELVELELVPEPVFD